MAEESTESVGKPQQKLTKKQLKALEFRNKKKGIVVEKPGKKRKSRDEETEDEPQGENEEKLEKKEKSKKSDKSSKSAKTTSENSTETSETPDGNAPAKKKRRRGKKSSGSSSEGPRFILFVGNLPFKVTEEQVMDHFKPAVPTSVRIRPDKGIAFIEFTGEDIRKRMGVALKLHHTVLGNRKINVELTAGAGGNSEGRRQKIKEKNEKLNEERKQRITIEEKQQKEKRENRKKKEAGSDESTQTAPTIHPSRLARVA